MTMFGPAALAAFGLSTVPGGGGMVAGCASGDNDPISSYPSDPGGDDNTSKMLRLRQRALLSAAPQLALGLAPTVNPVLPGAFLATTTSPVPLRLTRLEWPASTAPFFTISSIKVGLCDVIAAGAVSAEVFIAATQAPPFEFGVLTAGTPVNVVGTNIDVANHRADISFFGINLDGAWGSLCKCCP